MPEDVGYPLEIVNDPNQFKVDNLQHGDDRVSKMTAPTYDVDIDFDEMLKGNGGDSESMKLADAKKSNGKGKKY